MYTVMKKADFLSNKLSITVLEYNFQWLVLFYCQIGRFHVRQIDLEKTDHHTVGQLSELCCAWVHWTLG